MRIACIGDIHLISKDDPHSDQVENRKFFIPGQKALIKLFGLLQEQDIDLVIFLGDLVDWGSDTNIDFALNFLSMLKIPWKAVPGNHDLVRPADKDSFEAIKNREHRQFWQNKGLSMDNEWIDCDDFGICLVDNALSDFEESTMNWLDEHLNKKNINLVCQHVPLDLPEIRECIHSAAPNRPLDHYTCSNNKDIFSSHYQGRVQAVASGHVHMSGTVTVEGCTHHLCNVGIELKDTNRRETAPCSARILTFNGSGFDLEMIYAS